MHHPAVRPTLLALAIAAAWPAQATVTATSEGLTTTQPGTASISSTNGTAFATQAGTLQAAATANGVGGFTGPHVITEAGGSADYTVVGLTGPVQLDFHWQFSGARAWDVNNTAFGGNIGVGIFSRTGVIYIHNVSWGTSYVDGPPFMGDFAGLLEGPVGVPPGGQAGPPGFFGATVPAGLWGGIGSVTPTTHWVLDSGWTGTLSFGTNLSLAGDVQATQSVQLLSVTVASPSAIAPGGAWLQLDDGSRLAISAAVPEPGQWALLAAGALVLAALRRRRAG